MCVLLEDVTEKHLHLSFSIHVRHSIQDFSAIGGDLETIQADSCNHIWLSCQGIELNSISYLITNINNTGEIRTTFQTLRPAEASLCSSSWVCVSSTSEMLARCTFHSWADEMWLVILGGWQLDGRSFTEWKGFHLTPPCFLDVYCRRYIEIHTHTHA